jgi:hypothetical protein
MPRRVLWSSWTPLFDFVQDPESIDGTASWGCSPAIGCFGHRACALPLADLAMALAGCPPRSGRRGPTGECYRADCERREQQSR